MTKEYWHRVILKNLLAAHLTNDHPMRTSSTSQLIGELYYTLRFRRSEVAALGEFDVARTYEWIQPIPAGRPNPRWFPQLIVSQRFRAWAGKQRYRIRYGPCELVD